MMKKQNEHSYRLETSSLSSVKVALTKARKALPPRVARRDASDELALRLMRRIKTEYQEQRSTARRTANQAGAGIVNCIEKW